MCLAALIGLVIGFGLNICADWLPLNAEARPSGRPHVVRWLVLALLSTWLCVYLQRQQGWSVTFVIQEIYCSLLLLIAVIDLEHGLVPNLLVGIGVALALIFSMLYSPPKVLGALCGALVGGASFMLLALVRRNALGAGDVKLAALIGMMTGFPWVLQALILGIIFGGIAAAILLITRLKKPTQYMPYAPYLATGSIITLLHGQGILNWYATLIASGG